MYRTLNILEGGEQKHLNTLGERGGGEQKANGNTDKNEPNHNHKARTIKCGRRGKGKGVGMGRTIQLTAFSAMV